MDPFISATALADGIRRKDFSITATAQFYLDRVEKFNPRLNAFTWIDQDRILADAKILQDELLQGKSRGPFHGVPIPIKDLTEVTGDPFAQGSQLFLGRKGRVTSSPIQSLIDAGFLLFGRTNAPEFGTLPITENRAFGATRNPWSLALTPGGSSGGAAAAVAAGMAPIAHASDGGGSIRIPASCCGLVGLKPSRGRIPRGPLVAEIFFGFSSDGVVSRTVEDTAALLDILGRFDPLAWNNAPSKHRSYVTELTAELRPLRIGIVTEPTVPTPLARPVWEAVQSCAESLAGLGHSVFEIDMPWKSLGEKFAEHFLTLWTASGAYTGQAEYSGLEPHNAAMFTRARKTTAEDYARATLMIQIFSRKIVAAFTRQCDVILCPTIPDLPPEIGSFFSDGNPERVLDKCAAMVPYTAWVNATGLPAISLPTHIHEGVPIGVQLIGSPWSEHHLIALGGQLERRFDWPKNVPQMAGIE